MAMRGRGGRCERELVRSDRKIHYPRIMGIDAAMRRGDEAWGVT
jgi:hypothetical protein